MLQKIISPSSVPTVDFQSCSRLARYVAKRYGHCFCREFVFSEQAIRDVAERIIGLAVTEALRTFDPGRCVKFTTYLYRFLRFHAIKEYRSILHDGLVVFDSDALPEWEITADKGLEHVETADSIRFCSTIPESEIASIKRQYLPKPLRNMDNTLLKHALGELDREILQRLDEGENHCDIRRDFERRHGTDQRKFYRSRCQAIARHGKFGEISEKNKNQGAKSPPRRQ